MVYIARTKDLKISFVSAIFWSFFKLKHFFLSEGAPLTIYLLTMFIYKTQPFLWQNWKNCWKKSCKGSWVLKLLHFYVFLSLKVVLISAKIADPNDMQRNAAFHLGLYFLPIYYCCTRLGVFRIQSVLAYVTNSQYRSYWYHNNIFYVEIKLSCCQIIIYI